MIFLVLLPKPISGRTMNKTCLSIRRPSRNPAKCRLPDCWLSQSPGLFNAMYFYLLVFQAFFVCENLDLKCYFKISQYVREGRKDPNIRPKKLEYDLTVVVQ